MAMDSRLLELARALADPLRLAVLRRLMSGPATVSELMEVTAAGQSKVSNHLALLRQRGLVRASREGRQIVYELRDASAAQLVESLMLLAGPTPALARPTPAMTLAEARTCYDHLAGRAGVGLFDALVARRAIVSVVGRDGERESGRAGVKAGTALAAVELGPAAQDVFGGLDIDLTTVRRERRRFATACVDWTERRPHLGGALGAALWYRFVERGWLARQPGTRIVVLTEVGKRGLCDELGVQLERAAS